MLHISFISKPIMYRFYFLNPISESQRSQGWSAKERTFVCCIVLCVCFEASKPLLPFIIIRVCGGGPEHRHLHQGEKTLELWIPLIFVNAKCTLSGGLRFHIILHQKTWSYFSSQKESMISTVTYCFCVANQTAWKKSFAMFLKGQHKLWSLWINLTVHPHELFMFQLSGSCKLKQCKIKTVYYVYHIQNFTIWVWIDHSKKSTVEALINFSKCFFWLTVNPFSSS